MSEIDKLVNQAFPDELRRVEPVEVDEDAVLDMTLQKLGLDKLPAADKPEKAPGRHWRDAPARRAAKRPVPAKREESRYVEAARKPVQLVWIRRVSWAVAACMVIGLALHWGPRVLESTGFGTNRVMNPRAAGNTVSGGVNSMIEMEDKAGESFTARLAENGEDSASKPTVPVGEPDGRVRVTEVVENEYEFSVTFTMDGMTSAEIGQYEFIATDVYAITILPINWRNNGVGAAYAGFQYPADLDGVVNLYVFKLAQGEDSKYEYQAVRAYTLVVETGDVFDIDILPDDLYSAGIYPGSEQYNEANSFEGSSAQTAYDADS